MSRQVRLHLPKQGTRVPRRAGGIARPAGQLSPRTTTAETTCPEPVPPAREATQRGARSAQLGNARAEEQGPAQPKIN